MPTAQGRGRGARLWLVRHAEVEERWHETAYGAMDVPLSAAGLEATARMGRGFDGLSVDLVLASDLDRARRMGRAIAEATDAPLRTDPSLREMHRGEWQGLSKAEFRRRWEADTEHYWRDPFHWRAPGGEGDAVLFARAWPTIGAGLEEVSGGTLVIAAHGQLIRVIQGRILDLSVPESFEHLLGAAHATLLVDTPEGWRLEEQNVAAPGIH
jgi:glucosyl-3-phosphoglycerate phosphatase